MTARIYRPAKSVTQSGGAKSKLWRLDFEPAQAREVDPLMGWTGSGDMKGQIRLNFATKDEAIAYAERNGLAYRVEEPKASKTRPVSYSDNFRTNRVMPWTH